VSGPGGRPAFRHLVFDLDGTLVDTKDDLAEAVNVTLDVLGLPRQDPRTLWGYVGHGARVLLERALGADHAELLPRGLEIFLPWYGTHLLDRSDVYPGLRDAIERLATGGTVFSILTNKPAAMSRDIVRGLGLAERFPRVVGGDSLPVRKPDPSGLLQLIAAAGEPPAATLMVGDSAIDVATGRNAGVATCGVLWGFLGDAVRAAAPDALLAAPAQLLDLVRDGLPAQRGVSSS
jgi:phosphoglycolate phosphatase